MSNYSLRQDKMAAFGKVERLAQFHPLCVVHRTLERAVTTTTTRTACLHCVHNLKQTAIVDKLTKLTKNNDPKRFLDDRAK